jgi:uncharacterized protein (TIGR02246 family)
MFNARRRNWIAALLILGTSSIAGAQTIDPDAQKLVGQYQAAYNKGDVKALTALYTADATRLGPDGQLLKGRAAIEKSYVDAFAGALKGSTLTLQQGATQGVTADVKVIEGRYATAGGSPVKGRYVNTMVKQSGTWLLATVVTVPDPPAAK